MECMLALCCFIHVESSLLFCMCTATLKSKTICNLMYISVVWKKIDLRSMSKITKMTISGSTDGTCQQDLELKLMLDLFDHHM